MVKVRLIITESDSEIKQGYLVIEFMPEHHELRRSVIKFIDNEINPYVDEWEREQTFPAHDVFKKMGDLGFLGIEKPEKYGGAALDYTYSAVFQEALGHIQCVGVPTAIAVQTQMATPALAKYGSEELCQEFLVPTIAGDLVSSIGVSETGAGSDVASIETTARAVGGDYIIKGGKMWITNGTQADWMCLLANTEGGAPPYKNKTLIVLPLKEKGVTIARKLDKMGTHSSDTAQLFFEDVRVPQRYRIGEEGMGFTYQMEQFQEERLCVALNSLRSLQRVIAETIEYTRNRKIFGSSVLDKQSVHFKLAEMQTELELLRALTWYAVKKYAKGENIVREASMCKLKTGRLARQLIDACIQYWGGMGYMTETLISRAYRDFRIVSIGGGADEVMLSIICKSMGILPSR